MNELNELVGRYLNGFFITKVEKDPFVEGQINLWTDSTKGDFLGNREVVKFYVRDYPSGASIYQEQIDKEIHRLQSIIKEVREYIEENKSGFHNNLLSDVEFNVNELLEILDEENI